MKRAPALIAGGAITGFTGILIAHASAGVPLAAASPGPSASPGSTASAGSSGPATPAARQGNGAGRGGPARTAVGPGVNFGYGRIAIRVTVAGQRVVSVSVARLSTLDPNSQQICAQAIPILRSEVLSAQSANINAVSGATFTSEGYDRSLQAALDRLHA
jgi:FMN-binding domain